MLDNGCVRALPKKDIQTRYQLLRIVEDCFSFCFYSITHANALWIRQIFCHVREILAREFCYPSPLSVYGRCPDRCAPRQRRFRGAEQPNTRFAYVTPFWHLDISDLCDNTSTNGESQSQPSAVCNQCNCDDFGYHGRNTE